ncbi:hypothetical protein MTHERMOG20_23440 [Moorella thermoacetica]|uniref:Uncharacterized protein n=1 Tax=Moorella thermoacetica (strain ATCC 39073 / JCM 9320) TaxID=264732 RepID=Q2RLL4_MOOTA|nr:pilus assembly protein TadG-related protein [Moorella thermoacetica]AKX95732.1 hypothetical protein MOTHA_c03630 [Moorella thermoacetica]OIQ54566.1 hypothetical protein MOCA_22350 [Moorella thermoacetica]QCZ99542.1 hypothetical protein MothHH_00372 [Moorella thermoacetica]TYL07201.1 hypothetical protein MOOCA_23090 [Moorella thermoacetica]TYL07568.1 hypothetical protein MOLA_22290 [Moorella thermoacetica]
MLKRLLKDQRGPALIWFLIFLPVLMLGMAYLADYTQATTESDIDVQRALEMAVRAAAMQVTPDSQAAGHPRINIVAANIAFRRELASNLGLDANTLAPLKGSAMKTRPDYTLVVYNGDDTYAAGGALEAYKYVFSGGLTGGMMAAAGFPYTFGITSSDVLPGGGGTLQTSLDMPGVVAVISTSVTKILGKSSITPVRWAAAKIVCPNGSCGP